MPDHAPKSSPPLILVVDDDESVRLFLNRFLTQQGFAVSLASTGEQAVWIYRQHQRAIALVLMDIQMPNVDGPAILAKLQLHNPHVRCWFMTGDPGVYTEEDLRKRGAALVLRKPFDFAVLRQALAGLAAEVVTCQPLSTPE